MVIIDHRLPTTFYMQMLQSLSELVTSRGLTADAPVVELEEGADTPHDSEDVEAAEVLRRRRHAVLVVLARDQTLQQIACLPRGSISR